MARTFARISTTILALAVTLSTLAGAPRAAQACQPFQIVPALLGVQTEIASDGGILIAQVAEHGRRVGGGFTLTVDGQPLVYRAEYLAPGLERWLLGDDAGARVARAGTAVDVDRDGEAGVMTVVAAGARLKAPAIRAVRSTTARPPATAALRFGGPYTTLTIDLARPAPAGVVGLVVFGPRRGDPGLAWAPSTAGQTTFSIGGGGKRCGGGPDSIFARDRVSFAWVDARGRLSARTPLRAVALARPTAGD